MALPASDGGSLPTSNGSGSLSYPTDRMIEVANQMLNNANNSLAQHNAAWGQVQSYVGGLFGFMQGPILAVLNPFERRLRDSYQWQIDCATAILNGAGQMEQTDVSVARGFGRNIPE